MIDETAKFLNTSHEMAPQLINNSDSTLTQLKLKLKLRGRSTESVNFGFCRKFLVFTHAERFYGFIAQWGWFQPHKWT